MKMFQYLLIFLFLLLVLVVGGVSAEKSITLDIPATVPINKITTVPVTIHDADEILGFLIHVPNTIAGTTITVNETTPLSTGSYTVSSETDQTEQAVLWFTAMDGVTGTQTLFYLDILPTENSPSSIPLTVEVLDQMYDVSYQEVHDSYPVIPATLSVSGALGVVPSASPTPTPTPLPSEMMTPMMTPTATETRVPTPIETETIPPLDDPVSTPSTTTSPGFSVVILFAAIAGVIVLSPLKRR